MILALFCFALLIGVVAVRKYAGWLSTVTLVEYQRAVLYRHGYPVRDIGPGRYRAWTGIGKVMIVDARPVQVNYEHQGVSLRDGSIAVHSLSGSARVGNVRKTIYAAANFSQIPGFVLLCCARSILNASSAEQIMMSKDDLTAQITSRAKPRLAAAGFELLSFRLTELSLARQGMTH